MFSLFCSKLVRHEICFHYEWNEIEKVVKWNYTRVYWPGSVDKKYNGRIDKSIWEHMGENKRIYWYYSEEGNPFGKIKPIIPFGVFFLCASKIFSFYLLPLANFYKHMRVVLSGCVSVGEMVEMYLDFFIFEFQFSWFASTFGNNEIII